MSFLLAPVIAEGAGLIAAGLGELGLGSTLATTTGGIVAGAVGTSVGNAIDKGLENAAVNILGKDTVEGAKKLYTQEKTELGQGFGAFFSSDPTASFIALEKEKRAKEKQANELEQKVTTSGGDSCECENNQPQNNVPNTQAIINNIDAVTKTSNPLESLVTSHSSKELADLLITHTAAISVDTTPEGIQKATTDIIGIDPAKLSLSQKLSKFYNDKIIGAESEPFKELSKVFNGKGLGPDNTLFIQNEREYKFYWYDETGVLQTLIQNKSDSTIPAIYGVFGGPKSPNNMLPGINEGSKFQGGKVYPANYFPRGFDFPDYCFMSHDSDYGGTEGYFSAKADAKLVSRLINNKDSWPSDKVTLLNSIVFYFSTLAKSLSYLKGSLPDNVVTEVVDSPARDDIFPIMKPDALLLSPIEYNQERFEFYKDFEQQLEIVSYSDSLIAQSGFQNYALKKDFDSIMVEII